jgi:TRAP-type C4-dicarboxylate transport system permease small subunit
LHQPTLAYERAKPYIKVMSKLGYVIAAVLAIASMSVAWQAWTAMADVQISVAGTLAMILGALGALALGGVLMALLFISNRRGFDDQAGGQTKTGHKNYPD